MEISADLIDMSVDAAIKMIKTTDTNPIILKLCLFQTQHPAGFCCLMGVSAFKKTADDDVLDMPPAKIKKENK